MPNGTHQHHKSTVIRSPLEELFDLALKTCICEDRTTGSYALQNTEQDVLSEWASENKLLISKEEFELFLRRGSFKTREGGNEHDVFTSPKNAGIIKVHLIAISANLVLLPLLFHFLELFNLIAEVGGAFKFQA